MLDTVRGLGRTGACADHRRRDERRRAAVRRLAQLIEPVLATIDPLPDRQAGTHRGALVIGPAIGGDPLVVAVAMFGVLRFLADERRVDVVGRRRPLGRSAVGRERRVRTRRLVRTAITMLVAYRNDDPIAP